MQAMFVLTLLMIVALAYGCSRSTPVQVLYHYTSSSSANAIVSSGKIKISTDHIYFGEGVYFTALNPSTSSNDLLSNNYEINAPTQAAYSQVEAYFNCTFAQNDANLVHETSRRNIWRYKVDVKLADFSCKKGTRNV